MERRVKRCEKEGNLSGRKGESTREKKRERGTRVRGAKSSLKK